MTHTYDLIEPKFRRKEENKTEKKRNKQTVSLRRLFCISSYLLSISLSLLAISELRRKLVTNFSRFAFWDCFAGRFITRWRARAVTRVKRFCWKNEIFQEQSYPDRLSNVRKLCSNGGFLVEEEKYRVTEQS